MIIDGAKINCSPLVSKSHLSHIILGTDIINKNINILYSILNKRFKNETIKTLSLTGNFDKQKFLVAYEPVFKTEIGEYNLCDWGHHEIEIIDTKPIANRNFRIPIHYEKEIDDEIRKLHRLKIIRDSKSSWCSRIVPVKKSDGSLRLCIDFRPLNTITIKDKYPVP
jgi:hypothetical protein